MGEAVLGRDLSVAVVASVMVASVMVVLVMVVLVMVMLVMVVMVVMVVMGSGSTDAVLFCREGHPGAPSRWRGQKDVGASTARVQS